MAEQRRHRADAVSLIAGVVFTGLALGWLLLWTGALSLEDLGWAVPMLLIVAGACGILASSLRRK